MDPVLPVGASVKTAQRELPPPGPGAGVLGERPHGFSEDDLWFLLDATRTLTATLDLDATVAAVLQLGLPQAGIWCFLDLCEGEHVRRFAVVHADEERERLAEQLSASWPPERDPPHGIPSVLRTRRIEIIAPVADELLVRAANTPECLEILRSLQIGALMTVPLFARGTGLGAITYLSPADREPFGEHDRALAQALAESCALAIDNARRLDRARRARVRAEEANHTKMRFLSTMSHELRTPLNAIAGYSDLLETGVRGPLSEPQLADVRRIRVNQRHLLGLVESVLNYARVEAGLMEFVLEDLALAEVLAHTETIIAPLAEQKAIAHIGWHSNGLGTSAELRVRADREKLQQILVNLLANAVKFSPPGGRIDVTHQPIGARVEIRVIDDGDGIPADQQKRIFEPFVQLDTGLTRRHSGTGLGLAMSRELALGMGGELRVESVPGQGSTFTLTLPRSPG